MAASDELLEEFADRVYHGFTERETIDPLTEEADFSVEDAYRIQDRVIERIVGEDGTVAGYKLGLVSGAKQEQLGIDEPIFCPVPSQLLLEGSRLDLDECIRPRVEAEIGLVLGEPLEPPTTPTDVIVKTERVVPLLEIIESRFTDWRIPTAQDVIADITSCRRVVLGERAIDIGDVDLAMESVTLSHNGDLVETGVGADIMGNPARGVAWLADRLVDRGERLDAGDLVMTGGITAAVDIEPGDVFTIKFGSLGTVELVAD